MSVLAKLPGSGCKAAFALLLLGGSAAIAAAQYGAPPRDPGYSAFYHDQEDAPNYAAHWGYHDGLADGSHDRETGHSFRPTHDSAYKHAPSMVIRKSGGMSTKISTAKPTYTATKKAMAAKVCVRM